MNIGLPCFSCCCSVTKSCLTLCNLMDCSMPGSPVLSTLPEFVQIHVHGLSDAIQPSHLCNPAVLVIGNYLTDLRLMSTQKSAHTCLQQLYSKAESNENILQQC